MKRRSTMLLLGTLSALWMVPVPHASAQAPTEEELKDFERQAEQLEKEQAAAKAEAKRKAEAAKKAAEAKRKAAQKQAEERQAAKEAGSASQEAKAKRKAEIRDKGKVSRGWLGVVIQEVTRELAESFGMDKPHGALVAKVLPNSPAAAAGIKPGDLVVDFNGVEIDLSSDLPPLVGGTEGGEKIPVEIVRDGKSLKLDLEMGELPPEEEPKHASSDKADTATDNRLKIAVKDLTDKQREELELAGHGVVVERPARRAGICKGDIVTMIDDERVKDAKHFQELLEALPAGKSVRILVETDETDGGPIFLAIKVPAE